MDSLFFFFLVTRLNVKSFGNCEHNPNGWQCKFSQSKLPAELQQNGVPVPAPFFKIRAKKVMGKKHLMYFHCPAPWSSDLQQSTQYDIFLETSSSGNGEVHVQ
jgi:hypothetical protein